MQAELIGIGIATTPNKAWYIPFGHGYENAPSQLDRKMVLQQLQPIFSDPTKILIGENLKYVLNVFLRYGVEVKNEIVDTMLESYVQNSATPRHDKNTLSLKYLGRRTLSHEEVMGKGAKQISCSQIDIEKVTQFAAESADIALQLHEAMAKKITEDEHLASILTSIEMPLTKVLARMEYVGVLIDEAMLHKHSQELQKRLQTLEEQAYELAGTKFNLGSPKQLQVVLYENLKIPVTSKTPTGQPSTSEAILQDLALDYELPQIILEHRSLSKIKSTYTDRLPLQINSVTGRVHTCYNQAVTSTGRLSSTDPNLQNIPIRNEEGRRIRQAFIAPANHKIVSADYSQIELRIMAHISKDPTLMKAFEQNQDIHTATAAEVFNLAIENVTQQQRRSAKAINFGLIYGMSPFGLSRALGIDRKVAENYIIRYFERYPLIQSYMESTRQLAHQQGYVETLLKRRLYLPEINATNLQRQKGAERAAINAPLQGTAAEIIKLAMINIDQWLQQSTLKTRMIMQVHDELVFEVPIEEVALVTEKVREFMVNSMQLDVALAVDIGVGDNWDEAH
jgi:DNA polymerase-1